MKIFISPFQVKKELHLHMSLFASNLVAIATILKAKFAAKVLRCCATYLRYEYKSCKKVKRVSHFLAMLFPLLKEGRIGPLQ